MAEPEGQPEQIDITLRKFAPGFVARLVVMIIAALIAMIMVIILFDFGLAVGWPVVAGLVLSLGVFGVALVTLPFGPQHQTDVSLRAQGIVLHAGRRLLNRAYALGPQKDRLVLHWSEIDRISRISHRNGVEFRLRIRDDTAWRILGNLLVRSVPIRLWQSAVSEDSLRAALGHFLGQHGLRMEEHKPGLGRRFLFGVTADWTIVPASPNP